MSGKKIRNRYNKDMKNSWELRGGILWKRRKLPKNASESSCPGFRHLLFFVNSKNPVFKPFVAYFFVNFLNFICCTELYFYEKRAII